MPFLFLPYNAYVNGRGRCLFGVSDFYTKTFTPTEIDNIKQQTQIKNQKFQFNNFSNNADTRWIGPCGEQAFAAWLQYRGLSFEWHTDADKQDDRDFTVGKLEIDVKTGGSNYYPANHHSVIVSDKQHQKMMRRGNIINTLVFAKFIYPERAAALVGFITKQEFAELATFKAAGTQMPYGILSTSHYEIRIDQLRRIKPW